MGWGWAASSPAWGRICPALLGGGCGRQVRDRRDAHRAVLSADARRGRARPRRQPAHPRRRRDAQGAPAPGPDGPRDAADPRAPARDDRRDRDGRHRHAPGPPRSSCAPTASTRSSSTPPAGRWTSSASASRTCRAGTARPGGPRSRSQRPPPATPRRSIRTGSARAPSSPISRQILVAASRRRDGASRHRLTAEDGTAAAGHERRGHLSHGAC